AWFGRAKQNLANEVADTCLIMGRANTFPESVMAGNMKLFALISGNRSHSATTTDKEKR
ncbi:MAG: hypothetical protein H6R43_886, partial [Nitrospirae bacterium]|nr:hypothetical protein [Nitrospirota bacterium]